VGSAGNHLVVEVEHFEKAVGILGDQVDALRGDVHELRKSQAEAMAAALRSVLTDKKVVAAAMDIVVTEAQRRAAEKTGNAVGSMLKSFLTHWVIIVCIVVLVAKTAGIDVAAKVWGVVKGAV
jgi:hypothetical protein